MNKHNEIMVIRKEILFAKKQFYGYSETGDYETIILKNYEWMERDLAEVNDQYKQPICYIIICNLNLKKVFIYQRASKDKDYSEKRLQGKYSCGIGGHIEKMDLEATNPINASLIRELKEEVDIFDSKDLKIIGYINDEKDDVGKVHFGMLYLLNTNAEKITPLAPEIKEGKFIDIVEFENICNSSNLNVEGWTKISLESLKKYLAIINKF